MKENRTLATLIIWAAAVIALAVIFGTSIPVGGAGAGHILLSIVMVIGASSATSTVWGGEGDVIKLNITGESDSKREKNKRRSLEDALRNLSNADLERLRERLQDDNMDDELLTAYLADAQGARDNR